MAYPSIMIIGGDNTSDRFESLRPKNYGEMSKCHIIRCYGPRMSDAG